MQSAKSLTEPLTGQVSHQATADDAFVDALRAGNDAATSAFFHRYAPYVRSLLLRVLGPCTDIPDLVHDVFVEALGHVKDLKAADALKCWLATITVFVARGHIRKKRRRWWLVFLPSDEVPEVSVRPRDDESEVLRATYAVLDKLGEDERLAFTLRVIEEMPLADVAVACGVSLATAKRRIARAEERFSRLCDNDPLLRTWLTGGLPR